MATEREPKAPCPACSRWFWDVDGDWIAHLRQDHPATVVRLAAANERRGRTAAARGEVLQGVTAAALRAKAARHGA